MSDYIHLNGIRYYPRDLSLEEEIEELKHANELLKIQINFWNGTDSGTKLNELEKENKEYKELARDANTLLNIIESDNVNFENAWELEEFRKLHKDLISKLESEK